MGYAYVKPRLIDRGYAVARTQGAGGATVDPVITPGRQETHGELSTAADSTASGDLRC